MLKRFRRKSTVKGCPLSNRNNKLILEFLTGNLDCFESVYSRFSKPVFKYVSKYVKSSHLAEEITQDIFLKIYQFRKSYNPNYEASSWIWTIARNTVYDHLRQIRSSSLIILEEDLAHDAKLLEPTSKETAETIMIAELEKRKLLGLMAALSAKQKEAILLRMVHRFSYQEISNSMNLSLSAVKSLINRGKTSMTKLNAT